jgi:anti-sigma regulatory factor (Ser/Thr protein kinase)
MGTRPDGFAGRARAPEGFRHEALLYAGEDQFVDRCASFVRGGLEAGEPTLVVAVGGKLAGLREELGADASAVHFADMAEVGRNPARIIPAWHDFVERNAAPGVGLRGIGEPIFPEREAPELVECERHESLLNLAFADAERFWLLCPYDVDALPADVIEEARRNHPFVANGERRELSVDYRGTEAIPAALDSELPAPRGPVAELRFEAGALEPLRRFVSEQGLAAGLSRTGALDLVVAANEIAANSLKHGGGEGILRIWPEPGKLLCEIRDRGRLDDPLVDRRPPRMDRPGGRGLWLANQLCELVQVRSGGDELIVRLHVARP